MVGWISTGEGCRVAERRGTKSQREKGLIIGHVCLQIQHFISFSSKPILFHPASEIGLPSSC